MRKKIFLITVFPDSIVAFRGRLIRKLVESGADVYVLSSDIATEDQVREIKALGAGFIGFSVSRHGMNPAKDLLIFLQLFRIIRKYKPSHVVTFTIKANIWGVLASYVAGTKKIFSFVEGVGTVFNSGKGLKSRCVRQLVIQLLRLSLSKASKVVFINSSNERLYLRNKIVARDQIASIASIGVDISSYKYQPKRVDEIEFLLVGRLIEDKGVREFIEASKIVAKEFKGAKFVLIGWKESTSINIESLIKGSSNVSILEPVVDIRPLLIKCSVFVLPSYHEGVPRSALEAMAVGTPLLLSDIPGCNKLVLPGINGFLVSPKDVNDLADRLKWFCSHKDKIEKMGEASREIAEREHDDLLINAELIRLFELDDKHI